jgi:tRNA(Phe) wybutosine-synthesizing methylase Tyw3
MRIETVFDKETLIIFAAVIVVCVSVFAGANKLQNIACQEAWKHSGIESKYNFYAGCLIKIDGRFIPASNYRELP